MHHDYKDIRDKIPEEPQWFDENAVPRYCAFAPTEVADIYAREAALVLIRCQDCQHPFKVAFVHNRMNDVMRHMAKMEPITLADLIRGKTLHYGDPPNIGCCAAGPTMNCDDIRVLEYWRKNKALEWERDKSLEIPLDEVDHD